MSYEYDLVVRGGTVYDGTGGDPYEADVAVTDGKIAAVGPDLARGTEELDAAGQIVTPGFVDIHTHYDGQVTWESGVMPSTNHGVTTIVTGNCGVGFGPCRSSDHDELVVLMAGVEDIPEVVMTEGLSWDWTSFPEYLDAVDRLPHSLDVAAMIPHSALRVFVMGERAVRREDARDDDIAEMARLVKEAMAAGAIGFGTSRAIQQKSTRGEPIPTVFAAENELMGILGAMAEHGSGVFQSLSDFHLYSDIEGEFAMFRRLVRATGRPMSFTLNQKPDNPEGWRRILACLEAAGDAGEPIKGQVIGRPAGILLGHELTRSPFDDCPTYAGLAHLPLDERVATLRRPDVRERVLAESESPKVRRRPWHSEFPMGEYPDYEPDPATNSVAGMAHTHGTTPQAVAYDALLEYGGNQLLLEATQNYAYGSLDDAYEMVTHRDTVLGLGDGGAHLGLLCDASFPTTMLAHWTRDRTRGPKIPLPEVVRMLTSEAAQTTGLGDRGRIAVGYKGDLNVVDYDRVRLRAPRVVHDLPAGGRRIIQPADGYTATIVSGTVTQRDGEPTGAMPGRVVRGAQPTPA